VTSRFSSRAGLAGLGVGGRTTIVGYGILAGLRALSLILLAEAVAEGIASVVARTEQWQTAIALGLCGALLRSAVVWGTRIFAARSSLSTKERLRNQLVGRMLDEGSSAAGSSSVLAARGLDELDNYYRSVLPAITSAAVVPLFVGARLFLADWLSAVIVAATIILVPVFMALIGMQTRDQVTAAGAALARLSDHLVELAKGLPVLVGLGRAEEQATALKNISDDYRAGTMKTLRVAFMSSLALELISTISVAVVAVTIGFRLVWGDVSLEVALLVLILAPECFGPFRDLGTAFHASQDGLAAFTRVRAILDAARRPPVEHVSGGAGVANLFVRYAGRTTDTLSGLSFDIVPGEITAVQGVSGSGKSTLLGVLADQLRSGDEVTVSGTVCGFGVDLTAWLPQRPQFTADTVRAELELYSGADAVDGDIDRLERELGIGALDEVDPEQLSPGEARRVAFARVCLRVTAGARLVILDEPTAHLDPASAAIVARMIGTFHDRATVVLASHDDEINRLATNVVRLGRPTAFRPSGQATAPLSAEGLTSISNPTVSTRTGNSSRLGELAAFLRPAAKRYLAAMALGTLAVLFAIALIAVSGWLIVKASEHPSIMYLGVAIVGVRFFGVGRSALHYAERLVTHSAVFDSVTFLRVRMWTAFAARGATSRKMLGGSSVLDRLIGAADEVRNLAPRVLIPSAVGVLAAAVVLVAVQLLDASLLGLFTLCFAVCLVVAPTATLIADRNANARKHRYQSRVLRRIAATLRAAGDLRGNDISVRAGREISDSDRRASREARRSMWALGLGDAIIVFACSTTAVLTLIWTAPEVRLTAIPIELVAVLALLPLALIEPLVAATEAVQLWPALRYELRRVNEVLADAPSVEPSGTDTLDVITALELDDLSASWPGAADLAFSGVTARASSGEWLVIEGPSGSGKSTLLSVLLGYLTPGHGQYRLDGIDSRDINGAVLRQRVAWAPQDGYLFDSTIRANLLISRARVDAPTDEEMRAALVEVGLADLLDSLTHGLDTRVGSGGSELSGGQRQRVVIARTLLSRSDVVLLDEPTAHLDEDAAAALMVDLRRALSARIVVLVTHHHQDREAGDTLVELGHVRATAQKSLIPV
jgi:ATP-binding cassette subfamily C protein CydCD